jgi:hypothetical protein
LDAMTKFFFRFLHINSNWTTNKFTFHNSFSKSK